MCDDPRHVNAGPDHELLHSIAADLGTVKGKVINLENAMYGTGTTKGLVTKVDELRTGTVEGGQKAAAWTGGVIATIVSVIAGIISTLSGKS